ncbi:MAG: hypothetical protein AAF633_19595, partial [Chloroflexota bacterium]
MEFNWNVNDEDNNEEHEIEIVAPSKQKQLRHRLIVFGFLVSLMVVGYGGFRWWLGWEDQRTQAQLQTIIDQQAGAILAGEGDLFFAGFDGNGDIKFNQLRPEQLDFWKGSPTVMETVFIENEIWATVEFLDAGTVHTKVLTFANVETGPILLSNTGTYLGNKVTVQKEWGSLTLFERDQLWEAQIDEAVTRRFINSCFDSAGNLEACTDLNIELTTTYAEAGNASKIFVPSPHYFGLIDGAPSKRFLLALESQIKDHFRSQPVVFAVQQNELALYQAIRANYQALYPGREVD